MLCCVVLSGGHIVSLKRLTQKMSIATTVSRQPGIPTTTEAPGVSQALAATVTDARLCVDPVQNLLEVAKMASAILLAALLHCFIQSVSKLG
jgi:hypothetical protein